MRREKRGNVKNEERLARKEREIEWREMNDEGEARTDAAYGRRRGLSWRFVEENRLLALE